MSAQLVSEKYDFLLKEVADIALMQRVIHDSFKREFDILEKNQTDNSPSDMIRKDAFGLFNIYSGELEKYAFRKTSIAELQAPGNTTAKQ